MNITFYSSDTLAVDSIDVVSRPSAAHPAGNLDVEGHLLRRYSKPDLRQLAYICTPC